MVSEPPVSWQPGPLAVMVMGEAASAMLRTVAGIANSRYGGPRAWNGLWNDATGYPSVVSAFSATIRVICAASAPGARGRTTCKRVATATPDLMLALLRLVPQWSLTRSNGSGGELCEVGGSSPVDFRHRVGVVPQCGRSTAAVAKTRRGVA
jgi:hypothetical protein